ncbi:MAG: nuclear transport factor 2 family protein, partial [Acidimicrobiia bacterium]|nr:nuclear transport factor 2 family protein [Acidimicrobiia bacterium]
MYSVKSTDPRHPAPLQNIYGPISFALVGLFVAFAAGYVFGYINSRHAPLGTDVSHDAMRAWESGDPADIEAVYDPSVVVIIDGKELASDRDEMGSVIASAIGLGNTYDHVEPVAFYTASDGDVYIAGIVEVVGPGHPEGVPLVGFFRVRDG